MRENAKHACGAVPDNAYTRFIADIMPRSRNARRHRETETEASENQGCYSDGMKPCAHLYFHVGQRVMERVGNEPDTSVTEEVEVLAVEGRTVMTESGCQYDGLTGAQEPKGKVYRAIRSLTVDDRKKAENLLGGTCPHPKD